jgi:hypothetical protein
MIYVPENPPIKAEDLNNYIYRELQRVGAVMELGTVKQIDFLTVAPVKPRDGMVRGADGTYWNPGGGKGVYVYYNSAWNKL